MEHCDSKSYISKFIYTRYIGKVERGDGDPEGIEEVSRHIYRHCVSDSTRLMETSGTKGE